MPILADHPDLTLKRVFAAKTFTIPVQAATAVRLLTTTGKQILWIQHLKIALATNQSIPADALVIDGQPLIQTLQAAGGITLRLQTTGDWATTVQAYTMNGQDPLQIRRSLDLIIAQVTAPQDLIVHLLAWVADDTEEEFQVLSGPANIV